MGSDDKLSLATTEEGERGLATLSTAWSISHARLVAAAQDQLGWDKAACQPKYETQEIHIPNTWGRAAPDRDGSSSQAEQW